MADVVFWLCVIVVLVLDQTTKAMVSGSLAEGQTVAVVNGYLHFTHVRNPGGAFGLLPSGRALFLTAAIGLVLFIVVYKLVRGPLPRPTDLALGLALGGTVGNLADRLRHAEVIDWIDFRVWPVFNLADTALVAGLSLLALIIMVSGKKT